ncbi:LacI family DNA-binding transcriptional regulator [Brachybacterium alimentarium]|uniref:LacI family DNA-binding transcriptional regulator n=1 Tax=Brachybacterium alimentarium TaxID=47845 RepID=UPI000BB86714|nr:LacI family DNA-binding transcriptional regulator [Brachybacterium alimentarium]PCC32374.1 hypothetical protein CIK71_11875 [Brachybacterium alimentarium]RCS79791.1 LacI family transcriptional regulator [Brachybacterium alimentarium]
MTPGASPTLRDVAQEAGVSPAIASRVLNADPSVRAREDTRERVRIAAQRLGYVPHSLARSLRGARTGAIGLVMHGLDSPINVDVLRGAQARCAESGYVTLLAEAEELTQNDSQLHAFLARGRLDGVILHSGYGHEDLLLEAVSRSVPAVLVNADHGGAVSTVRVDDAAAAALAVQHLLDLGHREITFIAGPAGSETSDRRQSGYCRALETAGLVETADVMHAEWSAAAGRAAAEDLLDRPRLPTAVVVANAVTAAGVLSGFRDAAVTVPGELSVVGVHDSWFLEHLAVALTTVRLPLQALGAAAARVLIDEIDARVAKGASRQGGKAGAGINGARAPHDEFISEPPPQLILRSSTGVPRE